MVQTKSIRSTHTHKQSQVDASSNYDAHTSIIPFFLSLSFSVRMSFWGLFTFTAPYLPWVMLGFGFLLGNDAMVDFVGILIGHLYYFLWDICPIMFGRRILYTPRLIELIFAGVGGQPAADQPIIVDFENERIIQQQMQARQQGQQQQQQQPEDEGVILAD